MVISTEYVRRSTPISTPLFTEYLIDPCLDTERGFSDDESDSSTSEEDEDLGDSGFEDAVEDTDDDSGFEDAIGLAARLPSIWPQAENRVQAPEEECGPSKTLEDVLLPHTSIADKAKASLRATQSHSRQDHLDMRDVQTLEETNLADAPHMSRQELASEPAPAVSSADELPSVSVTPCHSEDRFDEHDMPSAERLPPQQQGAAAGGFNPMFSTPAHGRDRDALNGAPPLAVAPAARSAGSRRGHRERNRSKEDVSSTSVEAMRMHTTKKSAPVHASPLPSTSGPLCSINRPAGSTVKKYSYMSDTNWLKPKEDLIKASPSKPDLGSVAVPSEDAETQRRTLSISAEESPASDSATVSAVGTAGAAPSPTAWRNQRRPAPQTEQQRREGIFDDGFAKGESGAQGVRHTDIL